MLYSSAFEFLKLEVSYLRYDLREVLNLRATRKLSLGLLVHNIRILYLLALESFEDKVSLPPIRRPSVGRSNKYSLVLSWINYQKIKNNVHRSK